MELGRVQGYRDLEVWQRGMELAAGVYSVSQRLPREEMFGLTSQVRRAAAAVPANIAEGWGRETRPAYVNHLRIAQGSLKEVETHLMLAARVGMLAESDIEPLLKQADTLGRMLRALIRTMSAPAKTPPTR